MKKHNVAVLGLAHWYWAYPIAGCLSVMPDVVLSWVIGEEQPQAEKAARLVRARKWSLDYMDALEDPEVDTVVITSTTDRYEEMAVAAAEHKKNILIGKPVARTLSGADRIMRAVRVNGVSLIGYGAGPNPTDPIVSLIREGAIGRPYAAFSSCRARMPLRAPGVNEPGWFCDAERAAGGAFIDHAIYASTRMRAVFGCPVRRVYAVMRKMAHPEFSVEDYGIAMLEYENGAVVTIESTFGATEYTQNALTVTDTEGEISVNDDEISITGSREEYKLPRVTRLKEKNPVYLTTDDYLNPFAAQTGMDSMVKALVKELFGVVDDGAQSFNTIENARDGLEVCLAAYRSAQLGVPVDLPLAEDVDVVPILRKIGCFNG